MKRCFIIGGGPSINDTDLSLIKDEYVIGVNEAYRLGTWINTWIFGDSDMYKPHKKDIAEWPNRVVSCAAGASKDEKVEYYKRCKEHVICYEPDKLAFPSYGANSGATAINFAIREGFDEIILLGYDLRQVDGKNNYHNYYKQKTRADLYERFISVFEAMAKEISVKVINATPNSALNCFPKCELKDLF